MEATTVLLIAVTVSITTSWYFIWIRKRSKSPAAEETMPKECASTKTVSYWMVDDEGGEIHLQCIVPIDDDSPAVSDRYLEHLKQKANYKESS